MNLKQVEVALREAFQLLKAAPCFRAVDKYEKRSALITSPTIISLVRIRALCSPEKCPRLQKMMREVAS